MVGRGGQFRFLRRWYALRPGAAIDDGVLDVVLAERSSKLHFLAMLPKVFSGGHINDRHVRVRQSTRIRVDADRPFQVYADGDPLADLPAEIFVSPAGLRLYGPDTQRCNPG